MQYYLQYGNGLCYLLSEHWSSNKKVIKKVIYALDGSHRAEWFNATAKLGVGLLIIFWSAFIGFQYNRLIEGNIARISSSPVLAAEIEKPAAAPIIDTSTDKLQGIIDNFASSQPTQFGIYIKNLETGETAGHNENMAFISASLYKLVVGHEIYRMADEGKLSLDEVTGSGSGQSVRNCLNVMITVSDNPCGIALRSRVGSNQPLPQLASYGMTGTYLGGAYPTTTAYDIGQLYERINEGSTLTPASQEAFLSLLKNQQINNRLTGGLPAGTPFAHKTGDLNGYYHDAGIVYSPTGAYVISVMSGSVNSNLQSHFDSFGALSKAVYDHMQTSTYGQHIRTN